MSERMCIKCDEPITTAWAFRIRIGGVSYDDYHGALFVQDPNDYFRDYTKTKWLCRKCAEESGLYIQHWIDQRTNEIDLDICHVHEGESECGRTFEDAGSERAESALLIEWGQFCPSTKGPGEMFAATHTVHAHFVCACDAWNLPLWNLEAGDSP